MGRVMVVLAWVLVLAMLTLAFQPLLERQYNPNSSVNTVVATDGAREVVLQRNRAGHYIANGAINGAPVVFLLDTGATQVAVSPALARHLALREGRLVHVQTANGTVSARRTRLDRVELGGIGISNVDATIVSGMSNNEVLLGMSFLKQLEMIQKGNTLTLRQY